MKFTNEQMRESLLVLSRVNETGKLGYACARNRRKLSEEATEYLAKWDELVNKYFEVHDDSTVRIVPENRAAFEAEINQYSGLTSDVDVMTVEEDVFYGGNLTSQDMYTLSWMVSDS